MTLANSSSAEPSFASSRPSKSSSSSSNALLEATGAVLVDVEGTGANALPDFVGEGKVGESLGGSGNADRSLRLNAISTYFGLGRS